MLFIHDEKSQHCWLFFCLMFVVIVRINAQIWLERYVQLITILVKLCCSLPLCELAYTATSTQFRPLFFAL